MIEILDIKDVPEKAEEKKPEQPEWKERLLDVFLGGKVKCQAEKS